MGRGYGFQNAARSYLGKNITDVNVAEAALLAAILNRPGRTIRSATRNAPRPVGIWRFA